MQLSKKLSDKLAKLVYYISFLCFVFLITYGIVFIINDYLLSEDPLTGMGIAITSFSIALGLLSVEATRR